MSFTVSIKPKVLIWARTSRGLSEKDVASKLKESEATIINWESGAKKPSFAQVEKLASTYKRPLAAFLLSDPPKEPPVPKDYRTGLSQKHKPLTPNTLLAIRKARRLQISALELNKELDNPLKPIAIRVTLSENPETVGKKIRDKIVPSSFNISVLNNSEEAFEAWKTILEDNGVLVFQISIPQREIKGFSIIEGELPAIVINKEDEANSKIFSLFHELGHILLNESGICDMWEDEHSPAIEKFCNHFAGAFLVPSENLIKHTLVSQNKSAAWENQTLNSIAKDFRVSKEVVLRRLLIHGRTTNDFYKRWREKYVKEFHRFGRGKRNIVKERIQERGKKYVSMVFTAYNQAKIGTLDAADYLGVKIDQIPKVQEMMAK
jgi:Zn-dependent peptidase ImmA (M78 family)/DNA-binding XRE family transcriptional regulator